jgi:hypothetical protein
MRRKLSVIIFVLLLKGFVPSTFADDLPLSDLQYDFYGLWLYEETKMCYEFIENKIITYIKYEGIGFTVKINEWKYILNDHENNSENYPYGFEIFGTIEEMSDLGIGTEWWINIGDSDCWVFYLSKDKESLINYDDENNEYIWVKQ